jgi:iron complex transport system substrate-binding protein
MKAAWVFLGLALAPLAAEERIVSAGGGVTEIIYALGLESRLVGVDTSSTFPPQTLELPRVGYARALSAEGLLSLNPTHLICYDEAGPPAVLEHLRKAGVEVLMLPSEASLENAVQRIRTVAAAFDGSDRAEAEVARLQEEVQAASVTALEPPPKVLFIYARSGGVLNVSGHSTAADSMIRLAGGTNAVTAYEGYKPLTAEAALAANPDVILVTSSGLKDAGGKEAILSHPGLRETAAARNGRLVAMDDLLLLGFGPRLGQAVKELSSLLRTGTSPATAGIR